MNWRNLQILRAVLDTGGYAEAAAVIGLSHATVRRCVQRLEDRLGAPLFVHSPAGLTPTPVARALVPNLDALAAGAADFARLASAPVESAAGVVRVISQPLVPIERLDHPWAELQAAHPALTLRIGVEGDFDWTRFAAGCADVASTREPAPDDEIFQSTPSRTIRSGLYAHRRFIEAFGTPESIEDLARFAFVGPRDVTTLKFVYDQIGVSLDSLDFAFRSDQSRARRAAIRAGVGIGIRPVLESEREPDLVRVLPDRASRFVPWVVSRREVNDLRRVSLVVEAMVRGLGDQDQTGAGSAE